MITVPTELSIATACTSKYASRTLNVGVANGELLVTSKVPGTYGNRISVEILIDDLPGMPVLGINGDAISIRFSLQRTFEASGPFYYNGVTPETFLTLWYVGQFNGRQSWADDGLPITLPISRNGEFVYWSEGSWNMIRVESGSILMHWKADTNESDVNQIPPGDKTTENPEAWYGAASLCTGWVSSHYGAEVNRMDVVPYMIETGVPTSNFHPNPLINARIQTSTVPGQDGSGFLTNSIAPTRLIGGV